MFNLMDLMTTLVIYIQSINQSINQSMCLHEYVFVHSYSGDLGTENKFKINLHTRRHGGEERRKELTNLLYICMTGIG